MLLQQSRRAGLSLARQAACNGPLQLRRLESTGYAREYCETPSGSGADGPVNRLWRYFRRRNGNGDSKPEKPEKRPSPRPAAEGVESVEESTNKGVLVKLGGSAKSRDHPSVFAVALSRRPIMPGTIMPIRVKDERLLAELEEMRSRGTCYIGAFLKKSATPAEGDAAGATEATATPVPAAAGKAAAASADAGAPAAAGADGVPGEVSGIPQDAADHLHEYGTFGQVHNLVRMDETGGATLIVMGHRRLKRTGVARVNPLAVTVTHLRDEVYDPNDDIIKATANEVVSTIKELLRLNPLHKEQLAYFAQHVSDFQDPAKLADLGASMCSADEAALQEVVESTNVLKRLQLTLVLLKKEMELSRLQADIGKRVEEKISADQRKYFLNEQLKSIQKELGLVKDERTALVTRFEERLKPFEKGLTEDARRVITEELNKLKALEPSSSEFNVSRNYLEWLTSMPWGHYSQDILDVKKAQSVLDADHYGLEDVKERILEFIAVAKLRGSTEGKILCLVGPPGVGKTSIGRSIANALGRKFYRFSVGGLGDIVEIKGHRRTYVGSMPGKLVQCLKATGVSNPLVLIDEIDKIGRGIHGDPASALLELLDPEQNATFMDHYLDVPIDASKVLFVCTANSLDTIPGPLLDRMEVIRLSGYIAEEKISIARTHLEKMAREHAGVKPEQAQLADDAVASLIEDYAREPGVRSLQKYLEKIFRKVALKVLRTLPEEASSSSSSSDAAAAAGAAHASTSGSSAASSASSSSSSSAASVSTSSQPAAATPGEFQPLTIHKKDLAEYLGPPPMPTDKLYERTPVGVVTGLAWTPLGGSTLYIECTVAEAGAGKGGMVKTGQLGDVMRESADIAHTYARVMFAKLRPGNSFFDDSRLHVHVPAGATPKDGPSAGCTLITAMLSKALDRPVVPHLAMTGEVTLTGRVLPVGGIKEKTIAARRSGVQKLILPGGNRRDYDELPKDVTAGLDVHFVDNYEEVYRLALAEEGEQAAAAAAR